MKHILSFLFCCLCAVSLFAQAPEKMSYQAVVRNNNNALVSNTAVGMRLSILQGSISGAAVYVETQTPTTNAAGVVALEIGGGTVVSGSMAAIAWENGPFFIKTETDIAGGTNYTISGTSQLLSVPYALYAKTAGSVAGGSTGGGHYVGEFFGGGIVFYVDGTGQHGLIVSTENVCENCAWSNVVNTFVTGDDSPIDGAANTTAIIAQPGHTGSAAQMCNDYTGGGFTDWYLPTLGELSLILQNIYILDKALYTDANATTKPMSPPFLGSSTYQAIYWSSKDYDAGPCDGNTHCAWCLGFGETFTDGGLNLVEKQHTTNYHTRAVRAF